MARFVTALSKLAFASLQVREGATAEERSRGLSHVLLPPRTARSALWGSDTPAALPAQAGHRGRPVVGLRPLAGLRPLMRAAATAAGGLAAPVLQGLPFFAHPAAAGRRLEGCLLW